MILKDSRLGLNGLNFCTAAIQTGFGPFVAVWLTQQGWNQIDIGVALSLGTGVALVGQLPGGMVVDAIHHKRSLTAAALVALGCAALVLAWIPVQFAVWGAQIVHALASCIVTPAIAVMTLAMCGHAGFSERLGVNARYASIGNASAGAALGAVSYSLPDFMVFVLTAILVIPALAMLSLMPRADQAVPDEHHPALLPRREREHAAWQIYLDPRLHVFAICAVLFHLANAAMLPLALNELTSRLGEPGFVVSATIILPPIIVATLSPWIGRLAQTAGRRPVLMLGFLALPIRALLFATSPDPVLLVVYQALDGISATVFGLMVPLIAADLTRRTGSLNLAIGSIGLASGLGATFSTTLAGGIAVAAGLPVAFMCLAGAGALGLLIICFAMPETRPDLPPGTATPREPLAQPARSLADGRHRME